MEATRQAHSRYFAAYLQTRQAALEDWSDPDALADVDREVDNVRAAWEWGLTQMDTLTLASYLDSLWRYYRRKGWWSEAVFALDKVIQLNGATEVQRGIWRRWLGEANYQIGRVAASEEHLQEALALLSEPCPKADGAWALKLLRPAARQGLHRLWPVAFVGLESHQRQRLLNAARALNLFGPIAYQAGDGLQTLAAALWNLNLAERAGSASDIARACAGCGITFGSVPIHSLARAYSTCAIALARSTHDPLVQAYTLELAGLYRLGIGRWAEAEAMLTESVDLYQRLESPRGEIEARALLGKTFSFQGNFSAAHQHFSANLTLSQRHADPAGEYWSLTGLIECALWTGQPPLEDVLAWLRRAHTLLTQHSFGLADVVRGYGLLALADQRHGDEPQALEYAQTGLRWLKQLKLAGVWTLDGYAALAESGRPSPETSTRTRAVINLG